MEDHLGGALNRSAHRIPNAVAEGLTSRKAMIRKMAYGFRNKDPFRTAVLFRCAGLPLHPVAHAIPG